MLNQRRGFPLSCPSLSLTLPVAYLRRGVSIGDVGFMFDDGQFDFLFNIYLPAYHPVNNGECNVPADFAPLDEPEIIQYDYPPGSYVTNGFEQIATSSPEFSDALSFRSASMFGAICGLPCGSKAEKLADLDKIRQYAMSRAASWYNCVSERRCPVNGSLYLVTGTEKSDSWGIACVCQLCYGGSCMHLMNSKVHDENFPRYWVHSSSHTAEFTNQPDDFNVHGRRNQTLFLHGFKIGLGAREWATAMGRDGSILKYDYNNPRTSWIARLFSWMPKWLVSILWCWPSWFAKAYFVPFRTTRIFHPSIILTEYLLARVPDASSVIVHDDDWAALLRDNEAEPPDAAELLRRARKVFKITHENGGAYFTRRKTR
ncbi:hypothetical protein DFH06DRAFT_55381 [Mycena polygramma]|nr:hypothetical protein DFH06DRAFT_55381 [Mycena polygramma]